MESYIDLNGNVIKEKWKLLRDKNDERFPNDEDNEESQLLLIDDLLPDEICFNEDSQSLSFVLGSDYGWGTVEVPLSDDLIFKMIDHMKEKGEKIRRLINLTNG